MPITRRTLLVATAGISIAASVGGAALILSDQHRHAVATLERILGPLRLQQAELRLFLDTFFADLPQYDNIPGRAVAATSSIAADVLPSAPEAVQNVMERYERRLVTAYVTQTNHVAGGETTYVGKGACINPFAVLDEERRPA